LEKMIKKNNEIIEEKKANILIIEKEHRISS
jgi:hypothetical protein